MLTAIRHALVGHNREEQEAFLVKHIYRLTGWIEQTQQADNAGREPHHSPGTPTVEELSASLARFDRAKAWLADGRRLPRAEFNALRRMVADLERAMDAVGD